MSNNGENQYLTKEKRKICNKIRNLHESGEPLNVSAVRRLHPELLEKTYSIHPFWGWAQALTDAGLDYARINIELLETVTCKICGKKLKSLTLHLPHHGITSQEYQLDYPGEYIQSEALRAKRSPALLSKNDLMEHWESIWSSEYMLDRIYELHRRGYPVNDGYMHQNDRA